MLGITNVSNAPSIVLKNTVVSSWTSGSYNGYSYRGPIPIVGVTADTIAEVTFSQAQAESGNYSSVCTTYDGGLYVYSKVNTQITIPSIIIHSIVETYYEMDNSPVSGSTKAVTSGGVYDAINFTPILINQSSAQTFSASSNVQLIQWGTSSDSSRVTVSNGFITIKEAGTYLINARIRLIVSAPIALPGSYTQFRIYLNGTGEAIISDDHRVTTEESVSLTFVQRLEVNDTLSIYTYWNNTSVTLSTNAFAPSTFVQLQRLS